ncbi:MAG TPA: M20 family metallopeptidase, partial [Corynebacterium sp.]|nr:M20 family metallopeptidase [Corynebacterium sp.]
MYPDSSRDPRLDNPGSPSPAYLQAASRIVRDRMAEVTADARAASAEPGYPGQAELWAVADQQADVLTGELADLLLDLHAHPETAFQEYRSQEQLASFLERHGFRVQRGVHGVETSLRAEWAAESYTAGVDPTIAVLAEYDALPTIGHACGHNIIAAAGIGAFLTAVKTLSTRPDLPARLVLLGTPAEEGHSGKEYMIRGGMLEGIDAAVMVHPFSFDIASHVWNGRRTLTATFEGVAAHASSQPFMGRNALDAATLAYQGLGLLRQQMPPSDRLHAVISEGGKRPGIIPKTAQLQIYARSLLVDSLVDLSSRVDDILDGAALMAGVTVTREWDPHPMSLPIRNNQVLAQRWALTQQARRRVALPEGVVPDTLAASTDFGNVSFLVPGIHPMVKIAPEGVALHTEEFARWSASPKATEAAVDSSAGLAQVMVDLVADPELLDAAQAEFQQAGG